MEMEEKNNTITLKCCGYMSNIEDEIIVEVNRHNDDERFLITCIEDNAEAMVCLNKERATQLRDFLNQFLES